MRKKTQDNRYIVSLNPDYVKELSARGYISESADGRMFGISQTLNRSLSKFLGGKK